MVRTTLALALIAVGAAPGRADVVSPEDLSAPRVLVVGARAPSPTFEMACGCLVAGVGAELGGRLGDTSAFAVDRAATQTTSSVAVSPLARLHASLGAPRYVVPWQIELEGDAYTGTLSRATADGLGMPDSGAAGDAGAVQMRTAAVRLRYQRLIVGGGLMLSHFGLGLVANDGGHGYTPGSARFADPRGGDRVLRGFVATGPFTAVGLVGAIAAEKVIDDDALLVGKELGTGSVPADDTATAALATVTVGVPTDRWAGAYVAYRTQTSGDGRALHVTAFDVSAIGHHTVGHATLMAGVEAAYLHGDTSLAPSVTHPKETVDQFGAAVRSTLDLGRWGAALDGLYASGDGDLDDGREHGFRANHNFDMGLILFPQVLAAQTARGATTAANPNLVAQPVMGVERIPTRGSATNAIAVFPRAFVRPTQGVEVYGGPMFAWAATHVVDPFNTQVAGGAPTNALGGQGGSYLGTELDVGARARTIVGRSEVMLGLEGGVFVAGGALQDASGKAMASVKSARLILGVRL